MWNVDKNLVFVCIVSYQTGAWSFKVTNLRTGGSKEEQVSFTVTSYASDPTVEPILITSELSGSQTDISKGDLVIAYAEIRQGFSPVVFAEVWATVIRPEDDPIDIELLDNGAGECWKFIFLLPSVPENFSKN